MNYDERVLTVIALYFSFFLSAAVLSSEKCKSCKSYVQDGNFETADQRTGLCVHVHNVQSHILYVNICQCICVYIYIYVTFVTLRLLHGSCLGRALWQSCFTNDSPSVQWT